MKAYWYDNQPGDQRLAHDSGRSVDPTYLSNLGIRHYEFPDDLDSVNRIAAERHYKNRDQIEISPDLLPGYEEKVKNFFHEHLHEDEEIRYILAGGGYFDVRSEKDDWVRIRLEKGDLMIMPAGIYHRFTTDEQNVRATAGCPRRTSYARLLTVWPVHESPAAVQGRSEVDAATTRRRNRRQLFPEGVS